MVLTRIGLVARHSLPAALAALGDAAVWLDAHSCTPVIDRDSAEAGGFGDRWPVADRASLPGLVAALVAFGGDGTLLDAAGLVAHSDADVPVLGVNLGRLGFLTEVSRSEMVETLDALVHGRTRTETRLMLAGQVDRGGHLVAAHFALNDIVINRGAPSRMIEIDVTVDGQRVSHVKADGILVASATGSTAYNLSAGGPIVHPAVDAIVLTPIAPHALTQRPLVLPASVDLVLRPVPDDPPTDVVVTFDGQRSVPLAPDDVVRIGRAARVLRLLRTSPRTHFDMLREKLKWGN